MINADQRCRLDPQFHASASSPDFCLSVSPVTAGTGAKDTIIFSVELPAIIHLYGRRELPIRRDVIITGPGSDMLTVDGAQKSRVFHVIGGTTSMSDLTIQNGLLTSRRGAHGAGILVESSATLNLSNCTLSANKAVTAGRTSHVNAASGGGGLEVAGTATLTNCTLTGNISYNSDNGDYAGGIWTGDNTMFLNTLVAFNQPKDCATPSLVTSNGHNLDSDGTCFRSGGTDLVNTNPLLAPPADYGGPTATVALCSATGIPDPSCTAASPAIDAGDDSVTGPPDNLTTDQRGLPRLSGAHVDIGAYEAQ
jgi:hypothetical protein